MKRSTKFWFIGIPCIILLLLVFRWVGLWNLWNISSPSMSPALEVGDYIFTSNIPTASRGDIVLIEYRDSIFGENNYVFRLVADEGDTLEIVNGLCYVNNTMVDTYDLRMAYLIEPFTSEMEVNPYCAPYYTNSNSHCICHFDSAELKRAYAIQPSLSITQIPESNYPPKQIFNFWQQQGIELVHQNSRNFGPVAVPNNTVFVLADNRDDARDSRYLGFFSKHNLKSVVIGSF